MGSCISRDKKEVVDFPIRVIGITIFNEDGTKISYNKDAVYDQTLINKSSIKDIGGVPTQYVSKTANIQNQPHFESPFLLETEKTLCDAYSGYFNDI